MSMTSIQGRLRPKPQFSTATGTKTRQSQYRGVSPFRGKWKSVIYPQPNVQKYLGCFFEEIDAAYRYDDAARALGFPESSCNFPREVTA